MAPTCAIVHPSSDQSRHESAADRIWDTELALASLGRRLGAHGSRRRSRGVKRRIQASTLPYLDGVRNICLCRAVDSRTFQPNCRPVTSVEKIRATFRMGLSIRRIIPMPGKHVIDSLIGQSLAARGDRRSGQPRSTRRSADLGILEFGQRIIQAANVRDEAATGMVSNESADRLRPACRP